MACATFYVTGISKVQFKLSKTLKRFLGIPIYLMKVSVVVSDSFTFSTGVFFFPA
jgi:hypothetical protein